MNTQHLRAMRFEIDNLTSANQNLKSQLDDATTLLNTIRHSLGAQPGETALDTVNRVIAIHQDNVESTLAEVRKFSSRMAVLEKLVKERSDERDTAWAELKEIREAIQANPEESTADEVRRVIDQNAALAATVEALRDEIQTPYVCRFSREEKLSAILAATPQQNLQNLRGEAEKKGTDDFIAFLYSLHHGKESQVSNWADRYASIRQGGAE